MWPGLKSTYHGFCDQAVGIERKELSLFTRMDPSLSIYINFYVTVSVKCRAEIGICKTQRFFDFSPHNYCCIKYSLIMELPDVLFNFN